MGISNVGGSWGGGDRPQSQSGRGPSSVTTGGNQTDSVPGFGRDRGPIIPDSEINMQSGEPRSGAGPAPPAETVMMYVTLTIPQDKYEAWKSLLPGFIEVIDRKILDDDLRDSLGL
jgi:hypothetical protein